MFFIALFNVFCVSNVLCVLCVSGLLSVESTLDMDVFELLDSYIDEFHIVGFGNFFVNKLESFMLSKEVLQVEGVANEES